MEKSSKLVLALVVIFAVVASIIALRIFTCPEYVNCMPGPDVEKTCHVPFGCGSVTKIAH